MIQTEKEFNAFVEKFGGKQISDIVGISPGFQNADYLFEQSKVIAELKCLEDDKIQDPTVKEHATKLRNECRKAGYPLPLIPGTNRFSTAGLPDKYKEKFADIYRIRIQRVVKKANDQIRETKEKLGKDDYSGLLLLANDNNTAIHPNDMGYMLHRIFIEQSFPSIEHIVFFTNNLQATHPNIDKEIRVWMPLRPPGRQGCSPDFLRDLGEGWFAHLAAHIGEPFSPLNPSMDGLLNNLRNRKGEQRP
jgi:hypothetical protein